MQVIKRDGRVVPFASSHIVSAVRRASDTVTAQDPHVQGLSALQADALAERVHDRAEALAGTDGAIEVEQVQDLVVRELMAMGCYDIAVHYVEYRFVHMVRRERSATDETLLAIVDYQDEDVKKENANKNARIASTQRDYLAGTVSKDVAWRLLLDEDIRAAHEAGIIHFHDADYFIQRIPNCCLVNLEDMLQNGTVISDTLIEKPRSLLTAANVATQIVAQVASNQYGGQTISLAHLAPFVDASRRKEQGRLRAMLEEQGIDATGEQVEAMAETRVRDEIRQAIQTIQYQLVTLMTTNGQTPFVSVMICLTEAAQGRERDDLALLAEEMLRQRIEGVKDRAGTPITPAFPKILYVLDEQTMDGEDGTQAPYAWLTRLAAQCTAMRMVPDYISAPVMLERKGAVYPCMGCRSFLTPDRFSATCGNLAHAGNWTGQRQYYGRFNQGVVTINLPDVALSAGGDEERTMRLLEERLDLCHRALRARHERLKGTTSDVCPILFQHGALARLEPGEKIDQLLLHGYSTISLGYAGLYEMAVAVTGQSHTEPEGKRFAMRVMDALNDACDRWKRDEDIDYSLYGTPIESTTMKFASCLRERFGIVPGVTDHGYVTNSYHVNVREQIDAFAKLDLEAQFQAKSPGGAISYVETPDLSDNVDAVLSLMRHMHGRIMYAEINGKMDSCMTCGSTGPMRITGHDGALSWQCPDCGEDDETRLHVARRTCGYIGSQFWNQGRTEEIRDRVEHVSVPVLDTMEVSSQ